jgi:hypothetical protein
MVLLCLSPLFPLFPGLLRKLCPPPNNTRLTPKIAVAWEQVVQCTAASRPPTMRRQPPKKDVARERIIRRTYARQPPTPNNALLTTQKSLGMGLRCPMHGGLTPLNNEPPTPKKALA